MACLPGGSLREVLTSAQRLAAADRMTPVGRPSGGAGRVVSAGVAAYGLMGKEITGVGVHGLEKEKSTAEVCCGVEI